MNKYVKMFLHRGLMFSGLGPIVAGIVYVCIEASCTVLALTGIEFFTAVLTTYIIAFVHAGSSVFPQIEGWPLIKSIFFQWFSIYAVYTIGYLINSWIPLNPIVILIYTGCFIGAFSIIWIIIYLTTKKVTRKMNDQLNQMKNN